MQPSVWLEYRPIRIGWVVRNGDLKEFQMAARLSTCLWGGRFNPMIPTHNLDFARKLVRNFRVDLLIPMQETAHTKVVTDEFPHLIPGIHGTTVFFADESSNCLFADISHPTRKLYEEAIRGITEPSVRIVRPIWESDDPFASVFLATFGDYPDAAETGTDYLQMLHQWLGAKEKKLGTEDQVDPNLSTHWFPLTLSAFGVHLDGHQRSHRPGLFLGNRTDFHDLVHFWNLRAANIFVQFYDPNSPTRLRPFIDAFLTQLKENEPDKKPILDIYTRHEGIKLDLPLDDFNTFWIGSGLPSRVPTASFTDFHLDVVPAYSESARGKSISFPLPQKPFYTDEIGVWQQRFIVTVTVSEYGEAPDGLTFNTPCLPALNEFYGRNFHSDYSAARSQKDQMGRGAVVIITSVTSQQQTVSAFRVHDFLQQLFDLMDIRIKPSEPGLVCSRLMAQLGGVQGCRVLKVRGARDLIRQYKPEQSFTRSAALQTIGNIDPATNKPRFSEFENLYIEQRDTPKLQPSNVLDYLTSKGVFRVGLTLKCPNCALKNWAHIDDVRTVYRCEYCGYDFDITPQLKDRDWRYRRSGLFGRGDEQHGSIPVALTIQQLDTALHDRATMYSTALTFQSERTPIEKCEVDFIMLVTGREGLLEAPIQVLFGECKTSGSIDENDVRKLGKLADAVPQEIGDAFIMFANTNTFNAKEVELAKLLNSKGRHRVILWSREELEPYFVYERSKDKLDERYYTHSLSDMADATSKLFFENL